MARCPDDPLGEHPVPDRNPLRRLGIFGGTFNPIHLGHLRSALEVGRLFGLSRIYLIPAAIPPHKHPGHICPPEHRLAMVRTAVRGNKAFAVSDMELKRPGPSYTIDTVHTFIHTLGAGAENFLILGSDAFFDIQTWMRYKELLASIACIVMGRPGPSETRDGDGPLSRMAAFLKESTGNVYAPEGPRLIHPGSPAIHYAEVTRLDISATGIRRLAAAGESIQYLVPEAVRRYILEKGLYI